MVEAIGHSGGLWVLKHNGSNVSTTVIDSHSQAITFRLALGGKSWVCSSIYASPTPTNKPILWQHLSQLCSSISEPWDQIGDFNEITLPREQKGGQFSFNRVAAMLDMMEGCHMLEIPSTGGKFTWHHKRRGNNYVAKKLDRGLADMNWQWAFPDAYVEILSRFHSNHKPLLLRCGGLPQPRGPRPFRFEAAWIDHDDYQGWQVLGSGEMVTLSTVYNGLRRLLSPLTRRSLGTSLKGKGL